MRQSAPFYPNLIDPTLLFSFRFPIEIRRRVSTIYCYVFFLIIGIIWYQRILKNNFWGFLLLTITYLFQRFSGIERNIWFIFGNSLTDAIPQITNHVMQLPGFATAIQRCHKALIPLGVNLFNELSSRSKKNSHNSSLAINLCVTAIQVSINVFCLFILCRWENLSRSNGQIRCIKYFVPIS